ncbi:hypothetical protein [Albirhodobacter sp. R86504]|jgi:hypothetical protein
MTMTCAQATFAPLQGSYLTPIAETGAKPTVGVVHDRVSTGFKIRAT